MSLPKQLVFVILVLASLFLGKGVAAQVPVPPQPVDCDDTTDTEFHSLRPYQASPCKEGRETASFCGNNLVLTDRVSASRSTPPRSDPNCTAIEAGRYRCSYQVLGKTASYSIDLSNASFPILGNTEKVVNSQQQSDDLDSAEKTNEYVSWYLNGVTGRAEYGADENASADFAGPIKKLLPWSTQNKIRAETVKRAGEDRHDQVVGCVDLLGRITNCYPKRFGVREIRLSAWSNNLPPEPEEFEDFQDFWVEYQRWRGKSCAQIFGANICLQNPFKPDWPGNLYSYIPFSSTEDRVGLVSVSDKDVSPVSEDLGISNVSLTTTPAELYFSHTEEVDELADILQLTFVPEESPKTGGISTVAITEACDLTNIRSNAGDDLFATKIEGNLSYDAEFTCDFPSTASSSACSKDISVALKVITETPKADDIWQKLVAGPSSVFKRIFPKTDPLEGPIGCLLDIPGATGVNYSGSGLVEAGNPGARAGNSAELYFPHVGGVSEYFLKGIQTILRPKGYGEVISYGSPGDPMCQIDVSTDICSGECRENPTDVDMAGVKEKFTDVATRFLSGIGRPRLDKFDQVVNAARAAGVDPIFALAIWLHESGASNYEGICKVYGGGNPSSGYCQKVQDFGINKEEIETHYNASGRILVDNFNAQLSAFVNLPGYYVSTCGTSNASCPMEVFGSMFQQGTCNPNNSSNGYVAKIKKIYSWFSLGQTFPCYPSRVGR